MGCIVAMLGVLMDQGIGERGHRKTKGHFATFTAVQRTFQCTASVERDEAMRDMLEAAAAIVQALGGKVGGNPGSEDPTNDDGAGSEAKWVQPTATRRGRCRKWRDDGKAWKQGRPPHTRTHDDDDHPHDLSVAMIAGR